MKAAFTRAYNKLTIKTPYATAAPAKRGRHQATSEDAAGDDAAADEEDDDDVDDDNVGTDTMIKVRAERMSGFERGLERILNVLESYLQNSRPRERSNFLN